MNKSKFYKILFLVSCWVFAVIFIEFYEAVVLGFSAPMDMVQLGVEYDFTNGLTISVLFTIIVGGIMAYYEVVYLSDRLRKKPLGILLIIKTTYYLLNIIIWNSVGVLVFYSIQLEKSMFDNVIINMFFSWITGTRLVITILFWSIVVFLSLFILQMSEKFGQGILIKFLLGKYHKPKQEFRIFMFLDLKSSTTHAEKLGHIKYSQLIQDCFFDLTYAVTKCNAVIYQYVGDEVVLTWDKEHGTNNANCIKILYEFDSTLKKKKKYYENAYGFVPEFKAGVNAGLVTIAEVGELKKELAYHGDVLNTAARIQSKCNQFNSPVLVSQSVKDLLSADEKVSFEKVDEVLLRGKTESVVIYKALS